VRNDLTIYDQVAGRWWSDEVRWVRTLKNLVPGRLKWFDRHIDWKNKDVLDLGCAGGFMAEALALRGANVTGIDPAADAVKAARRHANSSGLRIAYDVGVGEALPYLAAAFDAVVCVDVLEHVADLNKVLAEVTRVLRPGGLFLFDTINRNQIARLATITVAEDVLRLLPRGTHDPSMFTRPRELHAALEGAGLTPGPITGLGPRGANRRFDLTFGPLPLTAILYMGIARKPEKQVPQSMPRVQEVQAAPEPSSLTVYYDGSCPLCRAEIGYYHRKDRSGTLCFVDVSKPDALLPDGLTQQQAMQRFNVRAGNGRRFSGAAAFVEVWARLPRWRLAARAARVPGALTLLELGYRLFLPARPALASIFVKMKRLRDVHRLSTRPGNNSRSTELRDSAYDDYSRKTSEGVDQ
jgi:2-polyprenyl-6-hydroxyphenyl methylase/3-demethylubiquinone-9 3-methyltransferase